MEAQGLEAPFHSLLRKASGGRRVLDPRHTFERFVRESHEPQEVLTSLLYLHGNGSSNDKGHREVKR